VSEGSGDAVVDLVRFFGGDAVGLQNEKISDRFLRWRFEKLFGKASGLGGASGRGLFSEWATWATKDCAD
jgi:hypothetical protein